MSAAATLIPLLNGAAVSVFGSLLSASFCGVLAARQDRRTFWPAMALMLAAQGGVYLLWDPETWTRLYPLLIHIPLLLLLHVLTGRWLWPAVSILSAYLFCQMRRWLALLAAAVLPGEEVTRDLAELALTVPLLLALLRFASPAVRELMDRPVQHQCRFGLVPALYWGFDYLARVYTDLLSTGSPVVVEFMPTVCCAAYLIFLLYNSAEERRRALLQQTRDSLALQMAQAAREIGALRASQAMAARHRHDLRHHLQYLYSCIEDGQTDRAKDYISGICAEIEAQQVQHWCENEAANLILSAFVGRAEKLGVEMDIRGTLPAVVPVSDNDLCVILSNALENALQACRPLAEAQAACTIGVELRPLDQIGRLFLQIVNPYQGEVRFQKGVPVSSRPGHGIGVRSILDLVERYGGGCSFLAQEGRFTLRLLL